MSWLNTIKGQLTTLAQEVLTEGGNILTDEDYQRSAEINPSTAIELLAETQKQKDELDKQCLDKDNEIAVLRKQIAELQNQKISDSGGGGDYASQLAATTTTTTAGAASTVHGGVGRTAKPLPDGNTNATLEDSWCWELDSGKQDNDHSSETSSSNGNGNEMVNITLEETPLPKSSRRARRLGGAASSASTAALQKRVLQLEEENKQLNVSLEELDSQHNLAIQNVLELKSGLQQQLSEVSKSYEALKKEHADKFIHSELEMGKLRKQFDQLVLDHRSVEADKQAMAQEVSTYADELKRVTNEMADLQALLEKKSTDNIELIERIKEANNQVDSLEAERSEWQEKLADITKENADLKLGKAKKTSESSSSSNGKQSEDEFIVVREGDANSSGPTTPPTKEELKDKIVQLENRVSELTLENGSLALKLQDREMEKELSANVLKENLETLQTKCNEQAEELRETKELMAEQLEKIADLKEKAATAILAEEKVKVLQEEKLQIETAIAKMNESLGKIVELEKRLVLSEHEKESLQLELQGLRLAQQRVTELESLNQKLTVDIQQLQLNTDDEVESMTKRAELEDKIKSLSEENESLRTELEAIAQEKFRQVIAEEKKEITDLDADDDDDAISEEKLRELLKVYAKLDEGSEFSGESLDKSYRELRDRLMKIDRLEKNLRQMSEEISDLQDSKLVWDHEKKTFEADISQYILQCDELMKNNEILLNELENYKRNKLETISENNEENMVQLETQLEECSKLNRTLEEEYAQLTEKNEELERENSELTEQLREAQETGKCLAAKQRDYTLQLETLELEKCNLLFELNEWKSTDDSKTEDDAKDKALAESQEKRLSLESQLESLSKDHADLVGALQSQKASLMEANRKREDAEKTVRQHEIQLDHMREQIERLQSKTDSQSIEGNEQLIGLRQELMAKDIVTESLKAELKQLQDELSAYNELKQEQETLVLNMQENELLVVKLKEDLLKATQQEEKLQESCGEAAKQLEQLHRDYDELQQRYATQSEELQKVVSESRHTSDDTESIGALQKSVDALNHEKNEMIKALQQKHTENTQYYMEIQRLQPIVQQLQQQQQQQVTCDKCPSLEALIVDLKKDQEKLHDQIGFLKEKSDILTTNLLTEQTNQRLVRQEKADIEEQNTAIRKDLDRLRQHLLEVEELHTQETVELQRELDDTKTKMLSLEQECAKSSNAYTSASIRANQHAETLQAQYALLVQQRDELVAKLSSAEDRESKNQAALCNLQCALEQFQNDKENDIKAATLRIRRELQHELNKEADLQNVIASLQKQLEDSNQGLRAASRLSDQLEQCQQTIAVLREEVETLKQQNLGLAEKLKASESSQSDKIDKNLIKSLLIGYVVSGNANDKSQVLRMISSVLEFTATESDKVGLNKPHSSWLGSILGSPQSPAAQHSRENLAQAFVQFLEQESQPKSHTMPTLLNMSTTEGSSSAVASASRRTSVASNSGSAAAPPVQPLPIVLNSNILSEFAPSRNSSSILKDILNDS